MPIELDSSRFGGLDIVVQDEVLPTPVTEMARANNESDEDNDDNSRAKIKIANLRHSYGNFEQVQFWSVADNVRYLGALMLIETLEILINDYF